MLDDTTPAVQDDMTACHVGSSPADGRTQCQNMALLQKSAVREHAVRPPIHSSPADKASLHPAKKSLATATDIIEQAIETNQMPHLLDVLKKKLRNTNSSKDPPATESRADAAETVRKELEKYKESSPKGMSKQLDFKKAKETSSRSKVSKLKEHVNDDEKMSSEVEDDKETLSKGSADKYKATNMREPKISASPVKSATIASRPSAADVDTDEVATSKSPKVHVAESTKEKTTGSAIQKKDISRTAVPTAEDRLGSPSSVSTVDGSKADLDEKGFRQIVSLRDRGQMKKFLRRVVRTTGLFIAREDGLDKAAASLSRGKGGHLTHSYKDLTEKVAAAAAEPNSWVTIVSPHSKASPRHGPIDEPDLGPGLTAPLNQDGYSQVAELRSASQMAVFIQRIINRMGFTVKNKYGLQGIVPWFNGESATQSYGALQREIQNTAMTPGQWVTADA